MVVTYSDCITIQLAQGIDVDHIINFECGFKSIKVLHPKWISAYNFLKTRKDDILTAFRKSGITDVVEGAIDLHINPFWDLL